MDALKRLRAGHRTAFTKTLNELNALLTSEQRDVEQIEVIFELLQEKMADLNGSSAKVLEAVLGQAGGDALYEAENDTADEYKKKFLFAQRKVSRIMGVVEPANNEQNPRDRQPSRKQAFKLPKIEIEKFSGNARDWLKFWNQFRKIHEDAEIDAEDKFQLLIQSMASGSRAQELVGSFPPSRENYEKAITSLTNRFGKEELQVEVYVRELLSLVLTNVLHGKEKKSLPSLYDKLETHMRALETLGVTSDKCAAMLFPLVESALPEEVLRAWQRSPTAGNAKESQERLSNLMKFLCAEVESEERISMAVAGFSIGNHNSKPKPYNVNKSKTTERDVPTATELLTTRSEKIRECIFCKGAHYNSDCSKANHMTLDERRRIAKEGDCCLNCLRKGHIYRKCKARVKCDNCQKKHVALMCPAAEKGPTTTKDEVRAAGSVEHNLASFVDMPLVYLQTLSVKITNGQEEYVIRALIDTGSQRSYLRSEIAEKLRYIPIGTRELNHALFGGVKCNKRHHNVYLVHLRSLTSNYACNFQVMDQEIICDQLAHFEAGKWQAELKSKQIVLSDVGKADGPIDLLIGADVAGKLQTGNLHNLEDGLTAIETFLGWTIIGKQRELKANLDIVLHVHESTIEESNITDLWRLDILGIEDPARQQCKAERNLEVEENFKSTTVVNEQGRYEVALPWKQHHAPISTNEELAMKRLEKTINKLENDGLREEYDKIFAEWEKEGIIEIVSAEEEGDSAHYLPHRAVVKESSSTTRVRPVFDASAHEKDSASLNQCLEKGSNLLELIPSILLGFREGEIGVTADIKRAFLQVSVAPKERNYLRFLLIPEATHVLKMAQFDLRGWQYSGDHGDPETYVLGIAWNKHEDTLYVNLSFLKNLKVDRCTRRTMLSVAQRVFDPIGYTSPTMITPKLLLQRTWKENADWDEAVSKDVELQFMNWLDNLHVLENIKIPRRLGDLQEHNHVSFHSFSDASSRAYAAVVFIRVEMGNSVSVQLIGAKSRIAPTKEISIPRLELLAAAISARLAASLITASKFSDPEIMYWSDSTTVISWINRQAPWSTFVHNRVQEIRKLTSQAVWRHVPGKVNPADLPSRGCSPEQLVESRWWEGPQWLKLPRSEWPTSDTPVNEQEINCELKKSAAPDILMINKDVSCDIDTYCRYFSRYEKIVRLITWVNRFLSNLLVKKNASETRCVEKNLTCDEIKTGEILLLKLAQKAMFEGETDPRLKAFNVFKDENGLLRVRSKIFYREDDLNFRCPILLDGSHLIVQRIIEAEHAKLGHARGQILLSALRENFWIISARRKIRTVVAKCVRCRIFDAKAANTVSVPLPLDRVRDAAVFEVTGVDLAGPLYLRGGEKAWICLFTCAVYRAVHIELLSSLSTANFLKGFRRFIGRRGRPATVFSDNGTNFVGAENDFKRLNWDKISEYSTAKRIVWKFNPPLAAWWRGWWERLIGLLKQLLRRILAKSCINYESMLTVLCDCESILNSRPLTYLSNDSHDLVPLTPNTFLLESREVGVPDLDNLAAVDFREKSNYCQALRDNFRKRFRLEYLGQLKERAKRLENRELSIGDLVFVGDDEQKRIYWPLGRIVSVFKGKDERARVYRVKIANGEITRPIQRLYPLELDSVSSVSDGEATKQIVKREVSEQKDYNIEARERIKTVAKKLDDHSVPYVTRSGRTVKRKVLD